jgi:sialic acid synthase SpsE
LLGYSDHSIGTGAAPYAVPMGICLVEKHFTIDKSAEGPDHLASLDPIELKDLVNEIRRIEKYLGSDEKVPTESEKQTRKSLQKCLVIRKSIKKGEVFSLENLTAKRTGGVGLSPIYYKRVLGKQAERDYAVNEILELKGL